MIDWNAVDFARPAAEIAEELGVAESTVYAARRRVQGNTLQRGRPKKEEPMQYINLRLSVSAAQEAARRAEAEGVTFSEWCRRAILEKLSGA